MTFQPMLSPLLKYILSLDILPSLTLTSYHLSFHYDILSSPPLFFPIFSTPLLSSPYLSPLSIEFQDSTYPIVSFEKATFFDSWFGLILAVQRQPVVVHIQATADTFVSYPGVSDYRNKDNLALWLPIT